MGLGERERVMAKVLLERWEQLAGAARYDAKELAKLCNLSVRQLERNFRQGLERSPQDWLNEQRIKAAQKLLLSGQPVKVVALELGFKQSSHFCRRFKSVYNMTPSQFAAQAQIVLRVVNR
jgi:AraC family transcriptional regulator